MPKDRGIDKVDAYFGDFTKIIAERIKRKGRVRILDAGCGYGVAMMGFVKRFGEGVEMEGYNYSRNDGDTAKMKEQAVEKGIFTEKELAKVRNLPRIIYCDASKRLPFPARSFDFIYSMASLYLYDDKIGFLEECNRILKKDGIARISPAFLGVKREKTPEYYRDYWEVFDKGKEVKIWNYANRIRGVRAVWQNRGNGDKPMYIELTGRHKIDFGLRLVSSIDYNFLWKEWAGVKSIYTTQSEKSFKPKWKVK
ncbi:MAG: methyltransferase domain-containing protein [archaeon]|jgi:SAM-dependent methyltransferase|nr:methyltransferase domain-containing protein [archaeon]